MSFIIQQLQMKLSDQEEKYEQVTKEVIMKSEEIKELRKEMDRYEKKHKESNEKLENETSKYELNVKHLKKLIEQLRLEKKDMENSNEYLKNNMEKLHKDLNESRQSEKSTNDILSRVKQEQENTKQLLNEQTQAAKSLLKEKEKITEEKYQLLTEKNNLKKETEYLNSLMDKVVSDFEKSIKKAEEKEKMFKDELDEAKKILYNYGREMQNLKQSVELKERRIQELNELGKMDEIQEKRYDKLKEEMNNLEKECVTLKENKIDLESHLCDLRDEYNKVTIHVANLEKELEVMESQLKIVLDQKEEDYVFYKKHITELTKNREEHEGQNQKDIAKLRLQLQEVTAKLDNEKIAYETLAQIHKDVSGKFMRSIKDLVDVKNSKQDILEKVREDKMNLENMENEKVQLNRQIKDWCERLEKSNNQLKHLTEENIILQMNYTKALDKCVSLENQIKQMEISHHQEYTEVTNRVKQDSCQAEIAKLQNELEEKLATIHCLKMEISDHQKQITLLEIERSEITLQLHETEKKLETERNLAEQLKNTQKLLLAAIMQLRDDGKVDSSDCIHLLHMVRSSGHLRIDDATCGM